MNNSNSPLGPIAVIDNLAANLYIPSNLFVE